MSSFCTVSVTKKSVRNPCSKENILKIEKFDFQLLFVIDVTVINPEGRHAVGARLVLVYSFGKGGIKIMVVWFHGF